MAHEKLFVGNVFSTFESFETCLPERLLSRDWPCFWGKMDQIIEATNMKVI